MNNIVYINKEGWLHKWAQLLNGSKNLIDFPIWLQFFVKVLFQVINRGGIYHFKQCNKNTELWYLNLRNGNNNQR